MKRLLVIALGSGLGGGLRYGLDQMVLALKLGAFPFSTLLINLSGSLLIGYLAGCWLRAENPRSNSYRWHFWATGVCGGYTTFSSFSWQVLDLVRQGEGTLAGAYAAESVAFGLMAVWVGISLAVRQHPHSEGADSRPGDAH